MIKPNDLPRLYSGSKYFSCDFSPFQVDLRESCALSENIHDYPAMSMGKVLVDSIDDKEEMTIMDVSAWRGEACQRRQFTPQE